MIPEIVLQKHPVHDTNNGTFMTCADLARYHTYRNEKQNTQQVHTKHSNYNAFRGLGSNNTVMIMVCSWAKINKTTHSNLRIIVFFSWAKLNKQCNYTGSCSLANLTKDRHYIGLSTATRSCPSARNISNITAGTMPGNEATHLFCPRVRMNVGAHSATV